MTAGSKDQDPGYARDHVGWVLFFKTRLDQPRRIFDASK